MLYLSSAKTVTIVLIFVQYLWIGGLECLQSNNLIINYIHLWYACNGQWVKNDYVRSAIPWSNNPSSNYHCIFNLYLLTLISNLSNPYKFCFYCSATHVMSQVLQPKLVNKGYRGRHTFISVHSYCCTGFMTRYYHYSSLDSSHNSLVLMSYD